MTLKIHLISHTHWDREWYLPFQNFRLRLVHLLDELLELLETDPQYKYFLLDGQTIVLDDYLQVRPEREEQIRALVQQGRLLIGPWHILPDEFLVSPEATVRNLLQGERSARRFGAKMQAGYIPDPFGHIAQMPQILRGFGIEAACLQRGLSDEPCELWWQAPDGSQVFLAYLRDGYGNAYALPTHQEDRFLSEVQRLANSLLPYSQARFHQQDGEGHLLFMQGTDHMRPPGSTPAALAAARGRMEGIEIEHSTLPRYLEGILSAIARNSTPLETVYGELRSGKRHPLLPGVMSARMWIKQRNHACEHLLEKWAEPFSLWAELAGQDPDSPQPGEGAFLSPVRVRRPQALLQQGWRLLMENHPHDSICGCSVDAVHEEMRPRFDQVEQIGEEITRQSLEALARAADTRLPPKLEQASSPQDSKAVVVFNPVSGPRRGWVQVDIPLSPGVENFEIVNEKGQGIPHQVVETFSREVMNATLDRDSLQSALGMVADARMASMAIRHITMQRHDHELKIEIYLADIGGPDWTAWNQALADLQAHLADPALTVFSLAARTIPQARTLVLASEVPGYGYRTFWMRPAPRAERRTPDEVSSEPPQIANELCSLTFDPRDATFTLHDKESGAVFARLNRFMDGGDSGDEYNYAPPAADTWVEEVQVKSVRVEGGAVQQFIEVELELCVPESLTPNRRTRSENLVPLRITTRAVLTAGVRGVQFSTRVDNRALDHRLRVHFLTPFKVQEAEYDGHFHVIKRPIGLPEFESSWIEQPRPEAHQRAFTRVATPSLALTLANRGLPEVEVSENYSGQLEISLTLLRCVGWLSRGDFSTRRGHAGPMLATPGAQMQGQAHFEYALIPGRSEDATGDYNEAYAFVSPLRAVAMPPNPGSLPAWASLVQVSQPAFEISAIKAAEDDPGAVIVRGYNLTGQDCPVRLELWRSFSRAERANLAEKPTASLEQDQNGGVHFLCKAHEIVTLKFSE
jgi:hypothetical protein